ncbi:MAG TPA: DMT family transporter, partial [Bacillota bacterium]
PLAFNGIRFVAATLVTWVMLLISRRPVAVDRRDLGSLTVLGLLGHAIYQVLFIEGTARTTSTNVTILMGIVPANVALLAAVLRVERVTARSWAGIALAFSGLLLVIAGGGRSATPAGDLMVFVGTIANALYTVLSTRFLRRYHPLVYSTWTMTLGTPALVLFSVPALAAQPWERVTPLAWTGLIYSAVFAIGVAYFIVNFALQRIGSVRTVLYGNVVPFVGVAFSALLLGDRIGVHHLLGALLVVAGVLVARLPLPLRRSPAPPASMEALPAAENSPAPAIPAPPAPSEVPPAPAVAARPAAAEVPAAPPEASSAPVAKGSAGGE